MSPAVSAARARGAAAGAAVPRPTAAMASAPLGRAQILELNMSEPLDGGPTPSSHLDRLISRIGEAVEVLGVADLRICLGSAWFEPAALGDTQEALTRLLAACAPQVETRLFAALIPEQFHSGTLALVEQMGIYPALAYPPEGRPAEAWFAFQDAFAAWREQADAWRIHRPVARITLDPQLNLVEVYRYLTHASQIHAFDLIFPDAEHSAPVQAAPYAEGLRALLAAWISEDNPNYLILPFHEVLQALKMGPEPHRWARDAESAFEQIDIDRTGRLGYGRVLPAAEAGCLQTSSLQSFLNSPGVMALRAKQVRQPARCGDCCWWQVCRGGELRHRQADPKDFDRESAFCEVLDDLFSAAAASLIAAGLPPSTISSRLGSSPAVPPAAIDTQLNQVGEQG
jgi:hypothetical protein